MAVYQDKAKERIKKHLRRMKTIVEQAKEDDKAEADVRTIVQDVLVNLLGWDQYANITSEQMIKAHYADFVVKTKDEELYVVEVKKANLKLKETHLFQAQQYAFNEGISWIVLTNGDDWQVYNLKFDTDLNIPKVSRVFSLTISNNEMKPKEKSELLYLLTEEASRKHEIKDYYERRVALSGENLARHILSEPVINKLRTQLNKVPKQRFTNKEIAESIAKYLFREETITDEVKREIKKL